MIDIDTPAGRLSRLIKEIQGHMRLRTSADRHEIRQQYLPLLHSHLVKRLEVEGKDAVPEVIDLMDSYYLTKEDWDSLLELGVGPMELGSVKLETQTKATFTRLYNQASHPMPFVKASNVAQPKGKAKEKPDLEEALEESDEGEVVEDDDSKGGDGDEGEADLAKDKYVKQPKKKKAAGGGGGGSGKGTGRGKKKGKGADDDEMDLDADEDEVPKKGKGAKGKGRGKK